MTSRKQKPQASLTNGKRKKNELHLLYEKLNSYKVKKLDDMYN